MVGWGTVEVVVAMRANGKKYGSHSAKWRGDVDRKGSVDGRCNWRDGQ